MPDFESPSQPSSWKQAILVLGFTFAVFLTVGFAVIPTIKQQLTARPAPPPVAERQPILKGDPEAGEKLFFSAELGCAQCHRMGGRGGEVAPDLTQAGLRYNDDGLRRAILLPGQRVFAPGFVTVTIVQTDGRIHTGIAQAGTHDPIRLRLPDGEMMTIPRDDVDEITKQPVSPMPQNYPDLLTVRQLSDLVAFLLRGPSDPERS